MAIIYSSIMGVSTLSAIWLAQPFFKSIDISLVYYGVLWNFLNVTAGFSSVNSYKYEQKHNIPNLLNSWDINEFIIFCYLLFTKLLWINSNFFNILHERNNNTIT